MKKLLLFVFALIPMLVSAHDIEVKNADGVTIYYVWNDDKAGLADSRSEGSYGESYYGIKIIPKSIT